MDKKPLENALLSDAYDEWLDRLLDMSSQDDQITALDKLAKEEPDLARNLRAAVVGGVLEGVEVQTLFSSNEAQKGDLVGAWQLDEVIAEGGMGTVWKAHRANDEFEHVVAIKILPGQLSTQSSRLRFERERQLLAKLRHSGIATLYDGGLTEQEHLWFALEYIPGIPLTDYCNKLELGIEARLVLFAEVCDAVAYAHEHGVIHRDIKPANILVEEKSDGPHVVLLDFGIAGQEMQSSELTLTGLVMGTPGYMSPEQARGDIEHIDRRSDVFSLGIILYELLNNQHPFSADTASETIYAILNEEPKSATLRGAPRDLLAIVEHCLEKKSEKRYSSAKAVFRDIKAYLRGEKVSVRASGVMRRNWRKIQRRPLASAVVGLSLIAGGFAILFSAWWSYQSKQQASLDIALVESVITEAQQIRDRVRLVYMRPEHNVENGLQNAHKAFDKLTDKVAVVTSQSKPTLNAALGITAQLLGKSTLAIHYLNGSWQKGVRTSSVFNALVDAHNALYFSAVTRARQIKNKELRLREVDRAKNLYLAPVQNILKQRGVLENPLSLAYELLVEQQYSQAIVAAKQAQSIMEWPWPAWQLEVQAWIELAQLEKQEGRNVKAKKHYVSAQAVLVRAEKFARSFPGIAATQCRLESSLVSVTKLKKDNVNEPSVLSCERLLRLSPNEEVYRALTALAYAKISDHNILNAFEAGDHLYKARELIGFGALSTVNGLYARGLINATEAEQTMLTEGDSSKKFLLAAESYESALTLDPQRWDIRLDLAQSLMLAGRSYYASGNNGNAYYARADRVWDYARSNLNPPLVALHSMGTILSQWAYDAWESGESKNEEIQKMLDYLKPYMKKNKSHLGLIKTFGLLNDMSGWELYWMGIDPEENFNKAVLSYRNYLEIDYSFTVHHSLFVALLMSSMYDHDHWLPSQRMDSLHEVGEMILAKKGKLIPRDYIIAMMAFADAEEHSVKGESPLEDFDKSVGRF